MARDSLIGSEAFTADVLHPFSLVTNEPIVIILVGTLARLLLFTIKIATSRRRFVSGARRASLPSVGTVQETVFQMMEGVAPVGPASFDLE